MRNDDKRAAGGRRVMLAAPFALLLAGVALAVPPQVGPDTAAAAPVAAAPLPWSQLNRQQRDFLQPLQGQWDSLPPQRQQRMAGKVANWQRMPPEKQARIQQRLAQWAQMTPEQRRQAARNRQRFQQMTPEQRQRVQDAYARFQSLSPAERHLLMQRFRAERQRAGDGTATPPQH